MVVCLWENIIRNIHITNTFDTKIENTAQLYFILGRAELHWNFSSWLRDVPDIHIFLTVHIDKNHFLLENLSISELSLGLLKKIQQISLM